MECGNIMGEIKSTLDLVLEKTRNLTMSEEEKQDLAREELDKKIQGLVNRYVNGILNLDKFKEEMEKVDSGEPSAVHEIIKRHLMVLFDFDSDNEAIVSAFKEALKLDVAPLETLQREYRSEREKAEETRAKEALETLRAKGISGTAVIPNLNKIPEWNRFLDDLGKKYREKLTDFEGRPLP